MSDVELTDEQRRVYRAVMDDIYEGTKKRITIGGYAGTGKTTLIKKLDDALGDFAVCAFTGKAANVLQRKGVPASTIHSTIYTAKEGPDGELLWELLPDVACSGFIVDEASMVSSDIEADFQKLGKPVIYVGDHGQLEPVGKDNGLMISPDYRLETIHRNSGDIAKFAHWLRSGNDAEDFWCDDGTVELVYDPDIDLMASVDQNICAFNKDRVEINSQVRSHLGFWNTLQSDDRVICLRNNRRKGVFNGMQGTVIDVWVDRKGKDRMSLDTGDSVIPSVIYKPECFGSLEKTPYEPKDKSCCFDYGWCITAHKAQGDEWGKVLVIESRCRLWSNQRWAYTAASRAREKLYWVPQ